MRWVRSQERAHGDCSLHEEATLPISLSGGETRLVRRDKGHFASLRLCCSRRIAVVRIYGLTIQFDQPLSGIALTFVTLDFQNLVTPSTLQLTA